MKINLKNCIVVITLEDIIHDIVKTLLLHSSRYNVHGDWSIKKMIQLHKGMIFHIEYVNVRTNSGTK